jgi:membrane-associated phospholipid phosphatase
MYRHLKWDELAVARKWFLLALIFGGLFLACTALYATGALDMATLVVERWIIGRPLTQFDCVLVEWKNFGAAPVNLVFIALLGTACGCTRYRWRVLPYLVILVLLGIAAEDVGKTLFALPLPPVMRSGMTDLTCPQAVPSPLQQLQVGLGMWWKAPLLAHNVQDWSHTVSQMPINMSSGPLQQNQSYPSGHAIRWWFTGLLLAWLFWRHLKRGVGRWLVVVLTLTLCFIGAMIQFYVGTHFISDTIAGYLLGTALACLGIGLFILNDKKSNQEQLKYASPASSPPQISSGEVPTSNSASKKNLPVVYRRGSSRAVESGAFWQEGKRGIYTRNRLLQRYLNLGKNRIPM